MFLGITLTALAAIAGLSSIRIVDQTERGAVETFGKYSRFANPGISFVLPIVQSIRKINITESMSEIESNDIITEDKLNLDVKLVVFYKVKEDEANIKNALYKVNNVRNQIITLAQTTVRSVIGGMEFNKINQDRESINSSLSTVMKKETIGWGIEIVRVELKEITPPKDVQEAMNQVIKAANVKRAATDYSLAAEIEADGRKKASIKEAEGKAQAVKLEASAKAEAIEVVNKAAETTFKKNAQKMRELEVAESSLRNNSKIILGANAKDVLKLFNLDK